MSIFNSKENEHPGSGLDKAPKKTVGDHIRDAVKTVTRDTVNGTAQTVPVDQSKEEAAKGD